ncbi:MAG: hypothetical protein Q4D06_05615 [Coriobacteriia bacterium]|nr:hypothetical protein [Coriobacteriia bacterium]
MQILGEPTNMTTEEALEQQRLMESQLVKTLHVKVEPDEKGRVEPVFYDADLHQKRKHGKWRTLPAPQLEAAVADTHCHLHMMQSPALSLARATINGVDFVCCITDPTEDGTVVFDQMSTWQRVAGMYVHRLNPRC